jgi:hypothetical protein
LFFYLTAFAENHGFTLGAPRLKGERPILSKCIEEEIKGHHLVKIMTSANYFDILSR